MRIGYFQFTPKRLEVEGNIRRINDRINGVKADVLVFPELFLTGYLFTDKNELARFAQKAGEGKIFEAMLSWAKKINGMVIGGFPEIDGEKIYNSSMAVMPDGSYKLYRKLHLFNREKLIFTPGNLKAEPFEFRGAKFGLMICFDWIFPEISRTLALKGAQILVYSSNLVLPLCQRALFARAVENRTFVILSNRGGSETVGELSLSFTGKSIIYAPDGTILCNSEDDRDEIKIVEVNPDDALDKNVTERNDIFRDRRTQFYEL